MTVLRLLIDVLVTRSVLSSCHSARSYEYKTYFQLNRWIFIWIFGHEVKLRMQLVERDNWRRIASFCCFYRCAQKNAPPYLESLLTPVTAISTRRHLRSAEHSDLATPRTTTLGFGPWSFSPASPSSSFWTRNENMAKFSILDKRKTKFVILDEIWTKSGQLNAEKIVKFFHITIMLLQLGWTNRYLELSFVAQYKISADIKSTQTWHQYILDRLQIKCLPITGRSLDEN